MSSETILYKELPESLRRLDGDHADLTIFMAVWFEKEIRRSMTISESKNEETAAFGASLSKLLIDLATGDHLLRWYEPLSLEVLKGKLIKNEGVHFIGRLQNLTQIDDLKRENFEKLFELLMGRFITPTFDGININEGDSFAVLSSMIPNEDNLKKFYRENHWALILMHVLSSYNLLGLDNSLLIG